ncbi:MAG TPA: hypothetical protein VHT52_17625 [Stellaceae bacterium]|jgi:hypothetical protein|nr:hypothetical protein [Stellaceae bacterium]
MLDREEHLRWCKERANKYLDDGDIQSAVAGMVGDLTAHPETKNTNQYLLALGVILATNGDYAGARRWVDGFR